MGSLVLWGAHTDLRLSSEALVSLLPIFSAEASLYVTTSTDWRLSDGNSVQRLDGIQDAQRIGAELRTTMPIALQEGDVIAAMGRHYAEALTAVDCPPFFAQKRWSWVDQHAVFVLPTKESTISAEVDRLTATAKNAFDFEFRRERGRRISTAARDALHLIRYSPTIKRMDRLYRFAASLRVDGSNDAYTRLLLVAAAEFRLSIDSMADLVESWIAVTLGPSSDVRHARRVRSGSRFRGIAHV